MLITAKRNRVFSYFRYISRTITLAVCHYAAGLNIKVFQPLAERASASPVSQEKNINDTESDIQIIQC